MSEQVRPSELTQVYYDVTLCRVLQDLFISKIFHSANNLQAYIGSKKFLNAVQRGNSCHLRRCFLWEKRL